MLLPLYIWHLAEQILQGNTRERTRRHNFRRRGRVHMLPSQLVHETRHARTTIVHERRDEDGAKVPIFVPILVGVIVAILFIIGIITWYRWKHPSQHNTRHRLKHWICGARRIRPTHRDTAWAIDAVERQAITRPLHQRLFSSGSSEDGYPTSPASLKSTAHRVGKSVQNSMSSFVHSLPSIPWGRPPIVVSQKPQQGFQMDEVDLMLPPDKIDGPTRIPNTPRYPSSSGSGDSSSGGSSGSPPRGLPAMFGIERTSGSNFELVDRTGDHYHGSEEDDERLSLLPRTPTVRSEATNEGSVILISRTGRDFSLRTKSTTDSRNSHFPIPGAPGPAVSPPPHAYSQLPNIDDVVPQQSHTKQDVRPLPPVPEILSRPPGLKGGDRLVQRPSPTAAPSVIDSSPRVKSGETPIPLSRYSAIGLRSLAARNSAKAAPQISVNIPIPRSPSEESIFLPSPGSPADSGAPTPIEPYQRFPVTLS